MKKAFTLVELLAVIILLGLLGLIIYPTVNGVINTNKQKLHDKQIEELVRHANTYAAYNMSNLKTSAGSRNIVTFSDLYEAGIIQNDKVTDPSNDEELTGCMALTWNNQRESFDIEYTENCLKYASISGTIIESNSPVVVTVELVQNNEVVYTTTTNSSGNYNFNNVETGTYILLVSQPYKTKYGREVEVFNNTTKDMAAVFYKGDFNEDNIVNRFDGFELSRGGCYMTDITTRPECSKYDVDNNGYVNGNDHNLVLSHNRNKITDIVLSGTANISGKVSFDDGTTKPTVKLINNANTLTATLNNDGTFEFSNLTKGSYLLIIEKTWGFLTYEKFIVLHESIDNINAHLIGGDLDADGDIDSVDVSTMNSAIYEITYNDSTYEDYSDYDLNEDGVIDKKDLAIVKNNLGKTY